MTTIYLHHDRHFDLVTKLAKGQKSTGQFEVETRDGTELRDRVLQKAPGGHTVIELPDGYEATPQALMHLVATVTERHALEDDIVAVSGTDGAIVGKLAALLNAEIRSFESTEA